MLVMAANTGFNPTLLICGLRRVRVRLILDKVEFEATNKPSDDYVDGRSYDVSTVFQWGT